MQHAPRLGFALIASLLLSAGASAARLVKDINSQPVAGDYGAAVSWVQLPTATLFLLDDGVHGEELWGTDGTAAGAALVKDIYPGPADALISNMTVLNGVLYFFATDGTNGEELWRSDGTATGTRIVADIAAGAADGAQLDVTGAPIPNLGGILYFLGTDTSRGLQIWRSDGTGAGTYRLSSLGTGVNPGEAGTLRVVGSRVFFIASEAATGAELWSTDGTVAGTTLVADVFQGPTGSDPALLAATQAGLFFTATDSSHGSELWFVNANATGAHLVGDLSVGSASTRFYASAVLGSDLVFSAVLEQSTPPPSPPPTPVTNVLFRATSTAIQPISNGVPVNANLVPPATFVAFGGRLLFSATQDLAPSQLWVTDGSAAGTLRLGATAGLFTASPISDSPDFGTLVGSDGVYFHGFLGSPGSGVDLWRSDGTPVGTVLYATLPRPSMAGDLAQFQGKIWLSAGRFTNNGSGAELWTADGTSSGMVQFADLNPGPADFNPAGFKVVGTRLYFNSLGTPGGGPWSSNGTVSGTHALAPGRLALSTADASPQPFMALGNRVVFFANDGVHGNEPWISDGTNGGTLMLANPTNNGFGFPLLLGAVGSRLLFVANDLVHGNELWATDGTSGGTYLVKDINPGSASSDPANFVTSIAFLNGVAYFAADDSVHPSGLWRSDGTAAGTYLITELTPGGGSRFISNAQTVNGQVLFQYAEAGGNYWWTTDGTAPGTHRVSAAVISTSSSSAAVGNFLYFGGQSTPTQNTNRAQLWRTDGTPGGTQLVADPAAANASTDISAMNAVRGRVVFQYCTSLPQYHCDVYASDGTAGGTVQIGANGIGMTAVLNGPATSPAAQLLYSYTNGSLEVLRVSDGTSAGTRDVKSWPAPAVIYSSTMTAFQGAVVFSMLDPVLGPVIWRSDGTPAGTVLVADIDPGASDQGVPFGFTAAGTNQLLFNGYTRQRGQELYALDTSGPNAADDSIAAPAAIATSIAVLANDGTLVSSVTASTLRIVTAPASGSATVNAANGTISYTGNAGFSGVDQFTYTVNDLLGGVSNVATVFVVVAQPVGGSPGTAPTAPPASGGGGSSTGPTTSGGGGGGLSLTDLLALLGLCLSLRRLSATPATHCPRRQ